MIKRTKKEDEIYNSFLNHKTSKKAWAIRAHCYECSCYQLAEVRKCPSKECPLWKYRLGPSYTVKDDKEK